MTKNSKSFRLIAGVLDGGRGSVKRGLASFDEESSSRRQLLRAGISRNSHGARARAGHSLPSFFLASKAPPGPDDDDDHTPF